MEEWWANSAVLWQCIQNEGNIHYKKTCSFIGLIANWGGNKGIREYSNLSWGSFGENVREAREALNVLTFSQSQKRKRSKQSNDGMHQSPSGKALQSRELNGVYCCCFLAHVKQRFPGACLVVEGIKREKQPNFQSNWLVLLKWVPLYIWLDEWVPVPARTRIFLISSMEQESKHRRNRTTVKQSKRQHLQPISRIKFKMGGRTELNVMYSSLSSVTLFLREKSLSI